MPSRLVPNESLPADPIFIPRRAQQRPHRCPHCGNTLSWEARSRVEQFAWDYFTCPSGCGRFYLQSGAHLLEHLD